MNISKEDIITTDKYLQAFPNNYNKMDVITCNSSMIWRGNHIYPPDKNLQILITGHSDYPITDNLVDLYNPKIWFGINKQTTKPNVYSIPYH
jgi:hypothetical protein